MADCSLPTRLRSEVRVSLGCVFVSAGAIDALQAVNVPLVHLLIRHLRGDWGGSPTRTGNATSAYLKQAITCGRAISCRAAKRSGRIPLASGQRHSFCCPQRNSGWSRP